MPRSRRFVETSTLVAWLGISCASCSGPDARIVTVSPLRVAEGHAATVMLATEGCSPRLDIDRGVRIGDAAALRLSGVDPIQATRTGSESFSVLLPGSILPGFYSVDLDLADGRIAHAAMQIEVTASAPAIAAIESPRGALSFGDTAIPFTITLRNDSLCNVDGLNVTPMFHQGTPLPLTVHGPLTVSLPAQSTTALEYSVDLDSTVVAGPLDLNATATQGTRSGFVGCAGTVDATNDLPDLVWVIVPPERQSLVVTGVASNPHEPIAAGPLNFQVTVRNDAATEITLERIDVQSDPPGVETTAAPETSPVLAPGAIGSNPIHMRAPAVTAPTQYIVSIHVSGRDGVGNLYNSQPAPPTVTFTVSP
jgi:hypothetical protein